MILPAAATLESNVDAEQKSFIDKYLKELREENAAVFVGAGLSKAAGYVDWPGLLAPIAAELGLDVAKETDMVALAQFHLNQNAANRNQLNQLLIDEFADLPEPTENHKLLARLPIHTYWTNAQLSTTRRGRDAVVYKMHGDIEHPTEAVLSKDDYESYHLTHTPFITALSGDLVEKTFLFLGFSFTDPNLDFILSRIRSTFSRDQRQHFALAKKRSRLPKESEEEFRYATIKQALIVADLQRFNIKTVHVDNYSDITTILSLIEKRVRRRTIFISGSAADYGTWGRELSERFLSTLAGSIIDRDFKIATGFGVGVGGPIVSGAVQQIYSTRQRSIVEQLILRPFPIGISDVAKRTETYNRYRRELVAQAGIAIFFMGNSLKDGNPVPSDGIRAEYAQAREQGLYLLPIGASGGATEQLWTETMENAADIFRGIEAKVLPLLEQLGKPVGDPMELLEPVLALIELLAKE